MSHRNRIPADLINTPLDRLSASVIHNPFVYIVLTLICVGLIGAGLSRAVYDNDPRAMFTDEHEGLAGLELLEQQFTRDDNLVFVIHPSSNNVFTNDSLALIKELTEKAWTLPKTLRVDSLANFQHTEALGDELIIKDLLPEADSYSADTIKWIRETALQEPALVKNVVSEKGHVASVNVMVIADEKGSEDAPIIMAEARNIRDALLEKYPNVDIHISGMVAFHAASQETTEKEMSTTSIYTSLAIFLCLWLMLRKLSSVFITFVIITLSNVTALGAIVWFGVELTPVMAGAPAIILTLAVADSIHLLVSYQQFVTEGKNKHIAMFESVRVNFQPVFLTSATTAIGFLFLNSSKSPPFADMANMVVIGVMAAFVLSIVFLPAIVVALPAQKYRKKQGSHVMERFANLILKRRLVIFLITTSVCGAFASQSFNNQLNDVWIDYFDDSFEVRRATDFMVKELTGHHRLMFAFPSGEPAGVMEPEYMKGLAAFADWARNHENVVYVSSFSDTIKRLNRDMNRGDPDFYQIPEQRELISQYALMYQMSLPFGLGLENEIDIERSATRVNVLLRLVSANDIKIFEEDAAQWIQDNLPANMQTRGVGFDLLLGELGYENGQGMLVGTALALVVVSFMLLFAMKSVKYGLLSMLPNLFPALISFGIWSYIDGYIGISVSIVACMTLGIIIDDTVHFLTKYKRAREELGLGTEDAIRYTFRTVGVALVATTIVIAANFGVMATSHYYPNSSMGLLTAITVIVALIVNFFIFVPVLVYIEEKLAKKRVALNDNQLTEGVLTR
ncbi:MAG: MMPL family transporter [Pseudomonadales bacterium]|nr:MMPL family transporter [Pseudomonadales bacterium]